MVSIKFIYSQNFEVERIRYTLSKIEWFKQHSYKVSLPNLINADNRYRVEDLTEIVKSEFDENIFKAQIDIINEKWSIYASRFFEELVKMGLEPSDNYILYMTRYGVGGSYNIPNEIIINIQQKSGVDLIGTIFHEIIHLNIEPLIQKYNISHWTKERIIDLILAKVLPDISQMQKLPVDCAEIDKIFKANFPDIEMVIRNI